ncbi:Riboflavin kinase domain bacterial/eukaryotic [Trinorchestia longiramus]|nr:Riboflavin kinase domain bacterial/eukaryotic [Trinorchestia longiramus]
MNWTTLTLGLPLMRTLLLQTVETHILHEFSEDFYGSWLRVVVLGYIRPEQNFESLDLLISAIKGDISDAIIQLSSGCFDQYYDHPFMSCPVETIVQNPSIVAAYNAAVHAVEAVDSKIQDAKSPDEADEKITSAVNGHLTNGHGS